MNINLKVRFKNPVFIVNLLFAVFTPILAYFGLKLEDLTSWNIIGDTLLQAIQNPYVIGLAIFNTYNTLVDPTTKGVGDSARALTYVKPTK